MTITETNQLLEIVQSFVPNFEITRERLKVWNKILGPMTYTDAERYMYSHFRENKFLPMPVDIISRARAEFDPERIIPIEPPDDMGGAR